MTTEQFLPRMPVTDKLGRLREALALARLDFDAVIQKCRRGELQFHDTQQACAITAITTSGPHKTCHVVALAGSMAGVEEVEAVVAAYAKKSGCDAIEADGREGWSRSTVPGLLGYKPVLVKYIKELD